MRLATPSLYGTRQTKPRKTVEPFIVPAMLYRNATWDAVVRLGTLQCDLRRHRCMAKYRLNRGKQPDLSWPLLCCNATCARVDRTLKRRMRFLMHDSRVTHVERFWLGAHIAQAEKELRVGPMRCHRAGNGVRGVWVHARLRLGWQERRKKTRALVAETDGTKRKAFQQEVIPLAVRMTCKLRITKEHMYVPSQQLLVDTMMVTMMMTMVMMPLPSSGTRVSFFRCAHRAAQGQTRSQPGDGPIISFVDHRLFGTCQRAPHVLRLMVNVRQTPIQPKHVQASEGFKGSQHNRRLVGW